MRIINKIIVHCDASDLPGDDLLKMKTLHTYPPDRKVTWNNEKVNCFGWDDYGYHWYYDQEGNEHKLRPEEIIGAHCKGENHDSIGLCLKGLDVFNIKQFKAVADRIHEICTEHDLDVFSDVYPHNHFTDSKSCPNFDMENIFQFFIKDDERPEDIEPRMERLERQFEELRRSHREFILKADKLKFENNTMKTVLVEQQQNLKDLKEICEGILMLNKKPWWRFW